MNNKIGIGTANFGSLYGVNRKKISKQQAKKIIEISKKNKINLIDTSSEYYGAEVILGNLDLSKFKIVTKIKIPNNFILADMHKIEKIFFSSLKKLKVKKIHALLIQNCDELLKKNGFYFFNFFLNLKKEGFINKLGFSIYSTNILNKLNKKFKFDIIQIPLNIFNQEFLQKDLLKKLKKKNIEIHTRSSFLQGLLLMKKNYIPKNFKNLKNILKEFDEFIKKNNYNKLSYLLDFSMNIKEIDHVIFGIDGPKQLEKLLFLSKKKKFNFKEINLKAHEKLIDPRLWKKK